MSANSAPKLVAMATSLESSPKRDQIRDIQLITDNLVKKSLKSFPSILR